MEKFITTKTTTQEITGQKVSFENPVAVTETIPVNTEINIVGMTLDTVKVCPADANTFYDISKLDWETKAK